MLATIHITTPCLNVRETIDRTILSVVTQAGDFFIRYHVQDGGSTDGTLERLEWWQRRIATNGFPLQCLGVEFTYASEPDKGMYDALFKGLAATQAHRDSFMTWINGDDMIMPGAFEFIANVYKQFSTNHIAWVGGAVSVYFGNMPNSTFDRPLPRAALEAGLCDGSHWDFVQQEGTFFRKSLWDSVDPKKTIRPLRLAGDWNLWRLFAQKASLVQTRFPLGRFRIQKAQLSDRLREQYFAEIEEIVSTNTRRQALQELAESGSVYRRIFQLSYKQKTLSVVDELQNLALQARFEKVFGKKIELNASLPYTKKVFQGTNAEDPAVIHRREVISSVANIISFNTDWQFPAITEQHSFHCIQGKTTVPKEMTYIAYPWASLIDKLQANAADKNDYLLWFRDFCNSIPKETLKFTVCQHIYARRYLDLFRQAGITHVFWPHATHEDVATATDAQHEICFHPFPLYPVQVPEALPEATPETDAIPRKYLFSFIGARANQHYLTEARNWILDLLADDPRGLVVGRESWHYHKIVYDLQIRGKVKESDAPTLMDDDAAAQFRAVLVDSVFSLCPSGSGPNSIRLWESIGAGAIPVILADTWAPPGDRRLWDMAAVFCRETPEDIRALPDRLAEIAADPQRLAQMRHAMRQLWLLYGAPGFVTDVIAFLLEGGDVQGLSTPAAPIVLPADLDADATPEAPQSQHALQLPMTESSRLLLDWSSRLLLDPATALAEIAESEPLAQSLARALGAPAEADHPAAADPVLCDHFRSVLKMAQSETGQVLPPIASRDLSCPAVNTGHVPRLCLFGRHAHRTPLAYRSIRRRIGNRLELTRDPARADLVVSGFDLDFRENFARLLDLTTAPQGPRLAVLSEEPLWDVTWSGSVSGRSGYIEKDGNRLDYAHLAHGSSEIFHFDRLPYYVVAEAHFLPRYAMMIARQAQRSPKDLLAQWQSAPVRAAFIAERRSGRNYCSDALTGDVVKLSGYRTELAEKMAAQGALCMGKGWHDAGRRQDLPDWHLDKLAWLHERCLLASAIENIHQAQYISEKIFDAFACGAVPVYFAGPAHRVFELIPESAMINTYGQEVAAAATRLTEFVPDIVLAEAWHGACVELATLFGDLGMIEQERTRIADAVVRAVEELLQGQVTELQPDTRDGPLKGPLRARSQDADTDLCNAARRADGQFPRALDADHAGQ